MMHFLPRPTFKRGLSMDALQQRSVPFSTINNSSSCGTPSESGDSHEIKFTHKEGCTPTACACVILAIIFVSLGAAAGVYFGLRFLDLGKRSERVYKGSFVIVGGDKYTSNLADTLSNEFQEKAQFYKNKLDKLFNSSIYKTAFLQSEILALNKKEDKKLVVHFNLHLSPEQAGLTAADLYVILSEEIMRSRTGVFENLDIDHDSLKIQERKPSTDDALDRWVPRRQYPGYLEGLTTPPNPETSFLIPRRCTNVEIPFCLQQSYNKTSYPNIAGHSNYSEVKEDLVTFRQVIDFECYPLAQEFICQLLQPECVGDDIVMPCKEFCEDFWKACKKLLPKKVAEKIDCSKFPKFMGRKECHQKPGCASELRVRGMSDRLCDGVVDCRDSSDENNCDYCRPGQFLCGDRQCIDMERRCDEREDCVNGVDERNCLTISPTNWTMQETLYSYTKDGFLVFADSGETSRVCSDNLNNSLPAMRRDIILQSLAVSTCSTLNFEVTENVEMRRDNSGKTFDHVQLLDPLASSISFAQVTCYSQNIVYVKCGATACGIRPAHTSRITRIYSRRPPRDRAAAQHGQWPWHVALFKDGQHQCDATLISDDWILASSSCFEKNSNSIWTAHIGVVRLSSRSPFDQESRITGMVRSPIGGGAITLLRLETPINGSDYVRPACLPTHDYTTSRDVLCITLWWSTTKLHLHEMKLNTTSGHNCSENLNLSSQNEIVCATNDNAHAEDCQGEEATGSPLLCNVNEKWFIMGVSNQRVSCSSKKTRVFLQTYEHVQWIHHTFDSLRSR